MFKNEELSLSLFGSQTFELNGDHELVDLGVTDIDIGNGGVLLQPSDLFPDANIHTDDTMDVHMKYNPHVAFIPISPRGPPERKNETGICNFIVEIDSTYTQKKKYLYSHNLNRIYVNMGCNFSIKFGWDASKVNNEPLYVRATTVFSDSAQAQKRVERCLQHSNDSSFNMKNKEPHVVMNILRSAREEGAPGVFYCGAPEWPDSWYSVLVRFAAPAEHAYTFVCKNSCSSGINRRSVDVVFTLEDCNGTVLGRQSVGARVCSSPRRDIRKDEDDFKKQAPPGKRPAPATGLASATDPAPAAPPPPGKRRRQGGGDCDALVTLPAIQVVGPRTAITGLRVMLNMMEQSKAIKASSQQPVEDLNKSINNLKTTIDNMEKDYRVNT